MAGSTWPDVEGRILSVESVNVTDPLGRQVVGTVQSGDNPPLPYSCNLLIWADIWRDRVPRIAYSKMKIG